MFLQTNFAAIVAFLFAAYPVVTNGFVSMPYSSLPTRLEQHQLCASNHHESEYGDGAGASSCSRRGALLVAGRCTAAFLALGAPAGQALASALDEEPPATPSKALDQMTLMLLPVAGIFSKLERVLELSGQPIGPAWKEALGLLEQEETFAVPKMKEAFNGYSDRANISPEGVKNSTPPANLQTLRYLARNELIGDVDNVKTELAYLLEVRKEAGRGGGGKEGGLPEGEGADLTEYRTKMQEDMAGYAALMPAKDSAQLQGLVKGMKL